MRLMLWIYNKHMLICFVEWAKEVLCGRRNVFKGAKEDNSYEGETGGEGRIRMLCIAWFDRLDWSNVHIRTYVMGECAAYK